MESNQINPSKIMQVGMGFWASKTLLTAVNLSLFTHLANGEKTGVEIKELVEGQRMGTIHGKHLLKASYGE